MILFHSTNSILTSDGVTYMYTQVQILVSFWWDSAAIYTRSSHWTSLSLLHSAQLDSYNRPPPSPPPPQDYSLAIGMRDPAPFGPLYLFYLPWRFVSDRRCITTLKWWNTLEGVLFNLGSCTHITNANPLLKYSEPALCARSDRWQLRLSLYKSMLSKFCLLFPILYSHYNK